MVMWPPLGYQIGIFNCVLTAINTTALLTIQCSKNYQYVIKYVFSLKLLVITITSASANRVIKLLRAWNILKILKLDHYNTC